MSWSLEDQIGQMILIGFRGCEINDDSPIVRDMREYRIGGVTYVDNEAPMGHTIGNVQSPEQVQKLSADLQQYTNIPLLISVDGEGGVIIRFKERFGFPPTISAQELGEQDDLTLTRKNAVIINRMLKDVGINHNWAPVVDLNKNPTNRALGAKKRCYSADPEAVIRHGRVMIEEIHEAGMACCLKHFPGHGSATQDSHLDAVDITETWSDEELMPYRAFIDDGSADAVMTAHVTHKGFDPVYPATMSKRIMHDLLRNELAFDGVVISDDLNMCAISMHYDFDDVVLKCIEAGNDMLLNANVDNYDEFIAKRTFDSILGHVRAGRLSEERINQSFERIMRLKRKYGIV